MVKLLFLFLPVGFFVGGFSWETTPIEAPAQSSLKHISGHLSKIHDEAPNELHFCGDLIPLNNPEVKAKLDREISRNAGYYASMLLTLKRANRYRNTFLKILRSQGVPEDIFYLAIAESHLSNASSPVGARGFWQFMPSTGRHYGLEISATVDERLHPEKATRAACRYLKDDHRQLKNWPLVAAAYNMGSPRLVKAIKNQGADTYFELSLNRETSRYLYRILAFKCIFEEPERYGYDLSEIPLYQPIPYRSVWVRENIANLATFAAAHGTSLRNLKLLNPWLIKDHLQAKPGKTYEIRIPLHERLHAHELVAE